MRLSVLFAAIVLILLGGVGSGWWWYVRSHPHRNTPAAPQLPLFAKGSEVSYQAKVRAQQVVQIPAPADGEVQQYFAEVGDEVYEGQLLARIHNADLESVQARAAEEVERIQNKVNDLEAALIRARLEESRANADATRARMDLSRLTKLYERQQLLYREGATPRLVYEKAEKDYNTAKSEAESLESLATHVADRVAAMQKDLDNTRKLLDEKTRELDQTRQDMLSTEVTSPVDGILVARRGGPGELVDRTIPDLLQIAVDLASLEAVIQMPPDVAKRLQPGYAVNIILAEVNNEPVAGTVKSVLAGEVVIAFTSPSPRVRPGLTAQVRIKLP